MIEGREVGLGRTRGLYRQFQARDEEECWIAIYRMQKEKKQPHLAADQMEVVIEGSATCLNV